MADIVFAWQSWIITDALPVGSIARRGRGESTGGIARYNIYKMSDGRFIMIGADEEKCWRNFCLAVGREKWIAWKQGPAPQTELIGEVQTLIGSQPLAYWNEFLDSVDCCYEPVLEPTEMPHHPQIASRGIIMESDVDGPVAEVLYPPWIDGRPPKEARKIHRNRCCLRVGVMGRAAVAIPLTVS